MTASDRTGPLIVIANWRDGAHPDHGGAEVVCDALASRLADKGADVVLLTARVEGRPHEEACSGYRIIRRGGTLGVYPAALVWMVRHRRRIAAVVDSQNGIPFFSPIVLRRDTPILLLMHHVHQDQFTRYLSGPAAALGRWLERTGTRIVYGRRAVAAVSPSTRRDARRRLGLRGDIRVVAPGCEPVPDQVRLGLARSPHPRIVCVGRLVPHKRMELLIEAMPSLLRTQPMLDLHLVGDGSARRDLARLVDQRGLEAHVVFHGSLDQLERDRLLATAWLTVNPSQGEGWGLSIVEANALGVPALAFRRPGLRDSIRDGTTGWLIDDDDDLAERISSALDQLADVGRATSMSSQAQQWVSRFTWDEMASQVAAALDAERGRLAHRADDRRVRTDLASVVHVPNRLLPPSWTPAFRQGDRWQSTAQMLEVLLPGADTGAVRQALRRAGLPETVIDSPSVRVEVARPADYLSPFADEDPVVDRTHEDGPRAVSG